MQRAAFDDAGPSAIIAMVNEALWDHFLTMPQSHFWFQQASFFIWIFQVISLVLYSFVSLTISLNNQTKEKEENH